MAAHKLLLADDSITIQRVIELTFAGEDLQVVAVSDGEQAIARIPVERPDIVLADIGMPKRSGYDVSAFVKSHPDLKHLPVLLLAGAFEPVDEAKAQQSGCDGVLVKPFEPQQVIARVRELLDGAKGSPTTQSAAGHAARPMERLITAPPEPARVAAPESARMPLPEPPAQAAPGSQPDSSLRAQRGSLDDYFDRLDAAFATLDDGSPAPTPMVDADLNVPTLDAVLARPRVAAPPFERPDASATLSPATPRDSVSPPLAPVAPAASPEASAPTSVVWPQAPAAPYSSAPTPAPLERNVIADAFSMMLAVERGEPGAVPLRLSATAQEPLITDAFIDEVVKRVIAKLSPDAAAAVVTDVVSDVSERLVREEIARIRGTQ